MMIDTEIKNVCVVGAGFMGTQIGLQCAVHGCTVWLHDVSESALDKSAQEEAVLLDEQIQARALPADQRHPILERVHRTTALREATARADLVIEAVKEDLAVKRQVFRMLDESCRPHAILTTNSSSIRISRIETATSGPGKVLNTHFVQPIWKHNFVELMRGSATSDATLRAVRSFMSAINVIPILVRRENTGFVFNRIWRAVKREALRTVDLEVATHEDVDRTWMIQMETPMGPFALMDRVGLDVVRDIEQVYFEESGDTSDAPPKVLLDKIEAGKLGVKTGEGFYTYPDPSWQSPDFLQGASP